MIIRPEFHANTGRIESFIKSARQALFYDEFQNDIVARLIRQGASVDEAKLAVIAAKLL